MRIVLFDFFPEPQHRPGKVICDQHRQGLGDAGSEHDDQLLVLQPFYMNGTPLAWMLFSSSMSFKSRLSTV